MSLEKYKGTWDAHQAAHLLRRTIYGPDQDQIEEAIDLGLDGCLDKLLLDLDLPDPPVNLIYEEDPHVPIGESWVQAPLSRQVIMQNYRGRSLRAWMIDQGRENRFNIREKMTLFWHNHFVVANINDARFLYRYITNIRTHATGDFKQLTKDMTVDPAMLRYLNGNQNTVNAPNENYARELLELFTVGKGDLAGDGDYTTFTEQDVKEIARILTGWRDRGFNSLTDGEIYSTYVNNRHDRGEKQLSHRFNNVVVQNGGENEYITLIDIIFQSEAVARHICRKLYRWFVYYNITDDIESEVIEPLAVILRENDYQLKPVLRALLASEHFYAEDRIGCMIKHPLEFLFSIFNQFNVSFPGDTVGAYRLSLGFFQYAALLQMEMFAHPSVAGWKPFYQSPAYYQMWINSTTIPLRKAIVDAITIAGVEIDRRFNRVRLDVLANVDKLKNPFDINDLLNELSSIMFPKPLTENQVKGLKNLLIPGLPDFEWTVEYAAYRDDPENEEIRTTVANKLTVLFNYMLNLPEYHLI